MDTTDISLLLKPPPRMLALRMLTRPGVTPDTLEANNVHRPGPAGLLAKYGFKYPGFVIPYYDRHGKPILDGGREFARVRLDKPYRYKEEGSGKVKEMKYSQLKDSHLHVYLPKGFDATYRESLVIVEGELKALSLVEAGIPSVGIGGFQGFQTDGRLLTELEDLLKTYQPKHVHFLGDTDTSHNHLFSISAVKLANFILPLRLLSPMRVFLPRIPIEMRKGIDDVRDQLGPDFLSFWQKLVDTAVLVLPTTCPKRLCLFLLEREAPKIAKFPRAKRNELLPRIDRIGRFKREILDDKYRSIIARAGCA